MATPSHERATSDAEACKRFFEALAEFSRIHAIKLYRLRLDSVPPVPVLPCLDHEAMLHEGIAPHAAAYVEEHGSGGLLVLVPAKGRIEIDVVSTTEEHAAESHDRVLLRLKQRFPQYTVKVEGPSRLRGERRVARACRAQILLRDVLMGTDFHRLNTAVDRLKTIGGLMEKESRVASWSVRTVTGPLLALAAFFTYQFLGALSPRIGSTLVPWLQYLGRRNRGWRLSLFRTQGRAADRDGQPRVEALVRIRADPQRASAARRLSRLRRAWPGGYQGRRIVRIRRS